MRAMLFALLGLIVLTTDAAVARGIQSGTLEFTDWDGPALTIHYVEPKGGAEADAPVVIVLHGVRRNADDYARNWRGIVQSQGVRVYAPEFSNKDFPGAAGYNLGGIGTDRSQSYTALEPLFDFLTETRGASDGYYIFGHSAGAQYTHRALLFEDLPRLKKAFVANAGWYTLPDMTVEWPYGLKGTTASEDDIKTWLSRPMMLLLGEADTDPNDPNLRRTPEADAQGAHRFARGVNFIKAGKARADASGVTFAWRAGTVPGIQHDNAGMAVQAAALIEEHERTLALVADPSLACDRGALQLRTDFAGAGGKECRRTDDGFELTIAPEAEPINPSPWFAFDIVGEAGTKARVALRYAASRHRYVPKTLNPQGEWDALPPEAVSLSEDGKTATLTFALSGPRMRIAAQPVIDAAARRDWIEHFATKGHFSISYPGRSVKGAELARLTSVIKEQPGGGGSELPELPELPELVVILGSQHPPETSGWIALTAFMERLNTEDALATTFRARFRTEIFPVLNPDGIDAGFWRLNTGLVDLNRDWGPFTQPETAMVGEIVTALAAQGHQPALLLDFHSTRKDVLYTPTDALELNRPEFDEDWQARINALLDEPGFDVEPGHNPNLPTAKSWFPETFGAPAITVEFGDETTPARARRLGIAAAEAMMEELLETP